MFRWCKKNLFFFFFLFGVFFLIRHCFLLFFCACVSFPFPRFSFLWSFLSRVFHSYPGIGMEGWIHFLCIYTKLHIHTGLEGSEMILFLIKLWHSVVLFVFSLCNFGYRYFSLDIFPLPFFFCGF